MIVAPARHASSRAHATRRRLVVDVGGVGYLVAATPRVRARVGEEATVETYLHVREDALQLYGFATAEERELFELLLGVTGIGPEGRARDRLGLAAGASSAARSRATTSPASRRSPASAARPRSGS